MPALPQYLKWSEYDITWSRADHPPRVDNPGQLALVVAPQVGIPISWGLCRFWISQIMYKVMTYSRFGVQRVVDLPPLLMTFSKFGVQRVEDLPPLLNTIGVQRVVDLPPLVIN